MKSIRCGKAFPLGFAYPVAPLHLDAHINTMSDNVAIQPG
jgi:hypothetical protein